MQKELKISAGMFEFAWAKTLPILHSMISWISVLGQCQDTKSNTWHAQLGQVNIINIQHVNFVESRALTGVKQW